jgi:putative sigma-54 modulation protein
MQAPIRITFRDFDASAPAEARIRERIAELEQFHTGIISCDVLVDARHHRQRQGRLFHVRLTVAVPGRTLVVNRDPDLHHEHEDLYIAIRDAFDAMRRQLDDLARQHHDTEKRAGREEAAPG